MNFQIGDYYSLPIGATDVVLTPQIAEFKDGKTKFEKTGKARLSMTVRGEHAEFDINVEKAKIHILLLDGQSNIEGCFGGYDENDAIYPAKGYAYFWDYNKAQLNEDFHKNMPIWEPSFKKGREDTGVPMTRGLFSALSDELVNLSFRRGEVEKPVIVVSARGGAPISHWVRTNGTEGDLIDQGVRRLRSALDFFSAHSDLYEVTHIGHIFLEGEGSEDENGVCDEKNFYKDFCEMIRRFNMRIPFDYTAILIPRTDINIEKGKALNLNGARIAQYQCAAKHEEVFIASNITENWNSNDKEFFFDGVLYSSDKLGSDNIHYNQKGYNIIAKEAARTVYYRLYKDEKAKEIILISSDGMTHYKNGDKISISQNTVVAAHGLTFDDKAVVAPYVFPLYAQNTNVEMGIYKDGKLTDLMDELGVIDKKRVVFPCEIRCKCASLESVFELTE